MTVVHRDCRSSLRSSLGAGGSGSGGTTCPSSSSSYAASTEGGAHELQRLRSPSSLRVLDVCTHVCAQKMRDSLRESFSVPESEGETGPTAQWLDMAADAAATAAADALELELKEEVCQASPLLSRVV